jgi:hypothetical protein
MSSRIATSIVAFAVLMAGTISPMGVCALMCEMHLRAQVHHQCGEDSDSMPGMAHNHSPMHHHAVGELALVDATVVVDGQSCQTDCAVAERLNISRKVVRQVTAVQTAVVLDATAKLLDRDVQSAWSLDSGPPSFPSVHTASYDVLRI